VLLATLALASGCSVGDERPGTRAVVIGIDGADWRIIEELAADGGMPNLMQLREQGAWGEIETLPDIPLSPVIWTSVATGKTATKHGISWFMVDQPDGTRVPVRSTNRKAEAVWNILDREGLSAGVVGWWATYPAESLSNGIVVSDGLGVHGFGSTARGGDDGLKVHPPALFERMDAFMPPEQQVTHEFVERFVHLDAASYRREMYDPARSRRPDPSNPIHLLQQYAVTAQGYTRIAEDLLSGGELDLCMVYFEQVDSFSHLFMKYDPPQLPWIDQAGFDRYRDTVREWYRYQDELLGRLLDRIDLETTAVFVLSDHGFKSGERRIRSEQTVDVRKAHLDHETHGIFVAAGPHVRTGERATGASVLDITPTVLHYLGLPVGKDMDGKVLESVFEPGFRQEHPIRYVGTHETGQPREVVTVNEGDSSAVEAGLRALGYMGDDEDEGEPDPDDSVSSPEIHNNLGRAHLRAGEVEQALAEFAAALELDPSNADALLEIGGVHQAEGRLDVARHFAERALQANPNSVGALAQLATIRRDQGDLTEAVRLYRQALTLDDSQPFLFLGLGDVLQRAGVLNEAEAAFLRVLELTPDSFEARYNLGVTYANMGRRADATEQYQQALAVEHSPYQEAMVLNNLGSAKREAGDVDGALEHFELAAGASRVHFESRFNAAMIYLERGRVTDAIERLEAAADLQPNHELISVELGNAYLADGRVEDAFRSYLLVRRLHPSNWRATLGLAAVRAGGGQPAEARQLLDEAVALGGEEAREHAKRFSMLAELLE
jgi:tetratricopeptide (TPR) repeat protein